MRLENAHLVTIALIISYFNVKCIPALLLCVIVLVKVDPVTFFNLVPVLVFNSVTAIEHISVAGPVSAVQLDFSNALIQIVGVTVPYSCE